MQKTREKILENFFDSFNKGDQLKSIIHRTHLIVYYAVLSCCIFFSTASANDNDKAKEDILNAIEKKYSGKSFEADFTQVLTIAAVDDMEKASGRSYFSHPGKMRWEYLEPEQYEIITNGKSLWMHRPQENQVTVGDPSSFFKEGGGGSFLSDISLIRKHYNIRVKEETDDYMEIDLMSKKDTPAISLIVIRISQKTKEIKRVVIYNAFDDTTRFEFSNTRFKPIDAGVFEFEPYDGLNIMEMN